METELERSPESLNKKLATVLLDCHAGDDPSKKHAQMPQQEIRGILLLYVLQLFRLLCYLF